jgi:hypothetical protein
MWDTCTFQPYCFTGPETSQRAACLPVTFSPSVQAPQPSSLTIPQLPANLPILPGPPSHIKLFVVFEGFEGDGGLWLALDSPRLWKGPQPDRRSRTGEAVTACRTAATTQAAVAAAAAAAAGSRHWWPAKQLANAESITGAPAVSRAAAAAGGRWVLCHQVSQLLGPDCYSHCSSKAAF